MYFTISYVCMASCTLSSDNSFALANDSSIFFSFSVFSGGERFLTDSVYVSAISSISSNKSTDKQRLVVCNPGLNHKSCLDPLKFSCLKCYKGNIKIHRRACSESNLNPGLKTWIQLAPGFKWVASNLLM